MPHLHVRQFCSERLSLLGQRYSMACTVDFSSVPSSSYLVWQSLRNVQKLTESLNGVANRIRWTWFLPEKEGSNLTHPVSPALGSWPLSSRLSVSREFAKCHRVDSRDRSFSHKIPFSRFLVSEFWHPAILKLLRTTKMEGDTLLSTRRCCP